MRIEELYAKYDNVLIGLNIHPLQHCIFDLTDENSQNSIKNAIQGIETVLMPECGNYLVVTTIAESSDCILLLFPENTDGNLVMQVFNMKTKKAETLTTPASASDASDASEVKLTIDNFNDFAKMEDIANRFNKFVFSTDGENSTNEVQNIGSFDVSNDEPVEIKNTNTDNEETEMKFKPINEEIEDTNEQKWVEIPNSNAHQITVEDGEDAVATAEDPFAGEMPAADGATAPEGNAPEQAAPEGDAAPATPEADASAEPATTEPATTEPAPEDNADATPAIDDPKAKMRELLAYYTNYMTELVQDPSTSTELIAATQDMIDSLIKNMESADSIEEVKADAEEDAKDDASAETPEGDATATAPEGDVSADTEPVAEAGLGGAVGAAAGAVVGGPIGAAVGGAIGGSMEEGTEEENKVDDEQAAMDAKIDAEIDDLHKDDFEDIAPATSDNILTPGDLGASSVNDVDLTDVSPTADDELAATAPDMAAPAPTSDVLDDTAPMTPDEEVSLMGDDDYGMVGPDGLPMDKFEGDVDALATSPVAKKIAWSPDYITSGVATSDDNSIVVPAVLNELTGYYTKVADEVSKVPGKEDIAMKLQKIQILSQTIAKEWDSIVCGLNGSCCANSYDRSNMCDLEKDELDSIDAMNMVGADVMADQEKEEEDDLAIANEIASFVESFKHLI